MDVHREVQGRVSGPLVTLHKPMATHGKVRRLNVSKVFRSSQLLRMKDGMRCYVVLLQQFLLQTVIQIIPCPPSVSKGGAAPSACGGKLMGQ